MDYSSWSVPAQTISFLEADMIIVISVLFVLGFVLVVRYSAKILPAIVGAAAYFLFGLFGAEAVCGLLFVIPGIHSLVASSVIVYCILRALIIALMYHLARCFTVRLTSKDEYTIGNCMMACLGNAAGLGLVSGFTYMCNSALANTINELGINAMIEGYTAEEAETLISSVSTLVNESPQLYLMLGLGVAMDIVFMFIAGVFLYGIFNEKIDKKYHAAVIAVNMFEILPTTLIESYSVESFMSYMTVKAVMLVLSAAAMLYADRMYFDREFITAGGSNYKTTTHLPRMKK